MAVDLRVYALLDPDVAGGRTLTELAGRIVGSATIVQLRDKHGSTRQMLEETRALMGVLKPRGIPLLVNDRVDVALAGGADGVHVGQDDMPPDEARRLLGPGAIIGLSLTKPQHAREAPLDLLDYLAVGAVFATESKPDANAPIGLEGLRELVGIVRARNATMPICAISGITAGNAGGIIAVGADGVAVISALSLAPDPAAAARALRGVVDDALKRRGQA
jgi:thiamine-phosphate pyrophosphorylase